MYFYCICAKQISSLGFFWVKEQPEKTKISKFFKKHTALYEISIGFHFIYKKKYFSKMQGQFTFAFMYFNIIVKNTLSFKNALFKNNLFCFISFPV